MEYNIEIDIYGNKRYYVNNVLHREGAPAIEYHDGKRQWYKNGKRHRDDGPAIEYPSGYKAWYKDGFRHREDGPAVEYISGNKDWYLNNKLYGYNNHFTNESWKTFVKTIIFS